jgi:hypothetical protein
MAPSGETEDETLGVVLENEILQDRFQEEFLQKFDKMALKKEQVIRDIEELATKFGIKLCRPRGVTDGKLGFYCQYFGKPRNSESKGIRVKTSKKKGKRFKIIVY